MQSILGGFGESSMNSLVYGGCYLSAFMCIEAKKTIIIVCKSLDELYNSKVHP